MIKYEILQKLTLITPEERRLLDGVDSVERELYMIDNDDIISRKKVLVNR